MKQLLEKMMDDTYYIYRITNLLNNRSYVGATNNPESRFNEHMRSGPVSADIKQQGEETFSCHIMEECTFDTVIERELEAIVEWQALAPKGYNHQANANYMLNTPYAHIYYKLMNCIDLINKGHTREDIQVLLDLTYVDSVILYHAATDK